MKRCFGVLGGDLRQAELARLLRDDGQEVHTWGLSREDPGETELTEALSAEMILLPLPLCWDDGVLNCQGRTILTRELFRQMTPSQLVLAGQVKEHERQEAETAGISLLDYFKREELTVANAIPTAEGAIQIAMAELPVTLCGAEVLVLGYGRIGKLLAHRFHELGARVTVAARKWEQRAWAKAFGCDTVGIGELSDNLGRYCLVVNTVPAVLMRKAQLCHLSKDCLYIDVASQPGLDQTAASELGLRTIWARGLPGKCAPVSAAAAIRDTIYHILEERGEHT